MDDTKKKELKKQWGNDLLAMGAALIVLFIAYIIATIGLYFFDQNIFNVIIMIELSVFTFFGFAHISTNLFNFIYKSIRQR